LAALELRTQVVAVVLVAKAVETAAQAAPASSS
jgi:hypothetical protein